MEAAGDGASGRRFRHSVHGCDAAGGCGGPEVNQASLRYRSGEDRWCTRRQRPRPRARTAASAGLHRRSAAGRCRRGGDRAAAQRLALGRGRRLLRASELPSRRDASHQWRHPRRRAFRHRFRAAQRQEHAQRRPAGSAVELCPISATRSIPSPTARWSAPPMAFPSRCLASFRRDATVQMAAGNHVVVDIGEGRFAFYAHMQPGSVRVKVGDTGQDQEQVLGLLGNSGNTDTPHLHFHVMDGPSPLVANGLPYVFTKLYRPGPADRRAASVHRGHGDHRQGCALRPASKPDASCRSGGELPVSRGHMQKTPRKIWVLSLAAAFAI